MFSWYMRTRDVKPVYNSIKDLSRVLRGGELLLTTKQKSKLDVVSQTQIR